MVFLTFTSRNTLRVFSTTTMVMALSPMSPPKPESPLPAGARAPSGSITTTTAASIFSFCNSQSSTNPFGVAISSPASVGIAAPPSTSPCPTGSFITTVTAPSPTSAANRASPAGPGKDGAWLPPRSEEHTSELQSRLHLVCRLLLENNESPIAMSFYNTAGRHPSHSPHHPGRSSLTNNYARWALDGPAPNLPILGATLRLATSQGAA